MVQLERGQEMQEPKGKLQTWESCIDDRDKIVFLTKLLTAPIRWGGCRGKPCTVWNISLGTDLKYAGVEQDQQNMSIPKRKGINSFEH